MAVPRPLLLALLGVGLLAATFLATQNARKSTSSSNTATQQQDSHASKPSAQHSSAKPAAKAQKPASASNTHRSVSKPAAKAARVHRASAVSKPAAVARAIARGRVVVLAFFQPAADDRASAAAVAGLRGRHLGVVFTDRIANVGRYGALVQGVGIDQAPAIVIVDSKHRARLIQGYVDPETLAQEVSDARG
jgi:hypothetical protein